MTYMHAGKYKSTDRVAYTYIKARERAFIYIYSPGQELCSVHVCTTLEQEINVTAAYTILTNIIRSICYKSLSLYMHGKSRMRTNVPSSFVRAQ